MTTKPGTPAALFEGVGRPFRLDTLALPEPEGAAVLVEVTACTLCGSDLHSVSGRRSVPVPTVLGHEILGRVSAFGPAATRRDAAGLPLEVGDRVTWGIVASCGACFFCGRGLPQKCEHQTKYGHEAVRPGLELTGGLAGHCLLVPGTAIFRVPDGLSDAAACPANCATATVAAALEAAGPVEGRVVLVLGCGMLGVTATAWARSLGASAVIATDVDPGRLALAATFGASHTCPPDRLGDVVAEVTGGRGVDAAVELTGSNGAIESAFPLLRVGGTLVLVGTVFPTPPVPLLPEQVVRRCLTIRGVHNYSPRHLGAALEFLWKHPEYPFGSLVAPWRPLSAINELVAAGTPSGSLRVGVRPSGETG